MNKKEFIHAMNTYIDEHEITFNELCRDTGNKVTRQQITQWTGGHNIPLTEKKQQDFFNHLQDVVEHRKNRNYETIEACLEFPEDVFELLFEGEKRDNFLKVWDKLRSDEKRAFREQFQNLDFE